MANQTLQEPDTQTEQQVEVKVTKSPLPDNSPTAMFSQEPEASKVLPRILLVALALGLIVAAPKLLGFVVRVYGLIVGSN